VPATLTAQVPAARAVPQVLGLPHMLWTPPDVIGVMHVFGPPHSLMHVLGPLRALLQLLLQLLLHVRESQGWRV
jgi:hypothetical protein